MATYVLIAGAWHRAACWSRIVQLLEGKGHRALAPDLPGIGSDRTPIAEDLLGQWTQATVALVRAQVEPVILVGHSRGGLIVSSVAEAVPERVRLAVYVAGCLLSDGEAVVEAAVLADEVLAAFVPSEDGLSVHVDPGRARELFYGQVTPEAAAQAVSKLVLEPMQPSTTPARLSAGRFGRVRRAYIETTNDRTIPIDKQRAMQARWPCDPVVALPSDHSPFYSMPEHLAEVLDDLARGVTGATPSG